uniref:BED-type domain-containing protein n=1 Tax=Nelumbo nucifera TaxID=4432 RepID=A0A822ZU50_NELNU|nr:TPA_asm: hypothetical protein HUJ06_016746 [Nelumbo nucifera]
MKESSNENGSNSEDVNETSMASGSSQRRTRSKAWEHFKKIRLDSGEEKAICIYYGKQYMGGSSKRTSHLLSHITRCPKMKEMCTSKQQAEVEFKFDQDRSRMDLAKMIMKHGHPFCIVEEEFFRYLSIIFSHYLCLFLEIQ